MKRFLLPLIAFTLLISTSFAAYPYDSVAEIVVVKGSNPGIGGSATLIGVTNDEALLLTCRHVVERPGNIVRVHFAATGEKLTGRTIRVGNGQDIAVVICPRPHGLEPVAVILPTPENADQVVNVGYPGVNGILEWQRGVSKKLTTTQLYYTCRPVPGMSGGATFDRYGNLVGIITHYQPNGGISSSGPAMMEFLKPYRTNPAKWQMSEGQSREWKYPLLTKQCTAPDSWVFFSLYIATMDTFQSPIAPPRLSCSQLF